MKLAILPTSYLPKVAYFLMISTIFYVYKKNLQLNTSKTKTAMNAKISIFVICVESIIYLLLHNLHDCTFKANLPQRSSKALVHKIVHTRIVENIPVNGNKGAFNCIPCKKV